MTDHARARLAWTFGDRLRKVRRDQRITQQQLASLLGVTAASIDAWEADRNKPRDLVGTAQRVEDRFGLPHGWMLGYADQKPGLTGIDPDHRDITREYLTATPVRVRRAQLRRAA